MPAKNKKLALLLPPCCIVGNIEVGNIEVGLEGALKKKYTIKPIAI